MVVLEVCVIVGCFVSICSLSLVIVVMIIEVFCENLLSSDNYVVVVLVDLFGEIFNVSDKLKF